MRFEVIRTDNKRYGNAQLAPFDHSTLSLNVSGCSPRTLIPFSLESLYSSGNFSITSALASSHTGRNAVILWLHWLLDNDDNKTIEPPVSDGSLALAMNIGTSRLSSRSCCHLWLLGWFKKFSIVFILIFAPFVKIGARNKIWPASV